MLTAQCRHGNPAPCPRCEASQRASDLLGHPPVTDSPRIPLATCEHLGRPCPPPPGGDPRLAFYRCEEGRGIDGVVCRCKCGPACAAYSPEVVPPAS